MARLAIVLGLVLTTAASVAVARIGLPDGLAEAREAQAANQDYLEENAKKPGVTTLPSGLQIETLRAGKGEKPGLNDLVMVHYAGWLTNGTQFDSSYQRGEPAVFPVSGVIPGWSEGLQQMQLGGKYRLVVPAELGYGAEGSGAIPPNSVLTFEVELIAFQRMSAEGQPLGAPQSIVPEGAAGGAAPGAAPSQAGPAQQ